MTIDRLGPLLAHVPTRWRSLEYTSTWSARPSRAATQAARERDAAATELHAAERARIAARALQTAPPLLS
jgi:heme-degrading monooxygenase HmoA